MSWTPALDDGGSAITGYEVISSDGSTFNVAGNVTDIVVYGLDTGAYTFTVIASNKFLASLSSPPSNAVDPLPGGTSNPLTPARVLDTRTSNGGHDLPARPWPDARRFRSPAGRCPRLRRERCPDPNVTVTDITAYSYLKCVADWARLARPSRTSISILVQAFPNLVEVALGSGGQLSMYNAAGHVDVIADVEGWVGDSTQLIRRPGTLRAPPSGRILDTRTTIMAAMTYRLGPGQTLTLQVTGPGGLPSNKVGAVIMNVTVANPTALSYLTVWPSGVVRPNASNLNFTTGETIPNRVTVGVGSGGRVNFYNAAGYVNVIADVNGWFTGSGSTVGGSAFVGVIPTRIIDTRTSSSCAPYRAPCPLGPGEEWVEAVASGPMALVMNVTVTQPNRRATTSPSSRIRAAARGADPRRRTSTSTSPQEKPSPTSRPSTSVPRRTRGTPPWSSTTLPVLWS